MKGRTLSESDVITRTGETPITVESLIADLCALGLASGMTVLVHSSLRAVGWVCGGPVAVVLALESVLGEEGTLVMPTHSGDLSDPAQWVNPPVPEAWWETIRRTMPAYDPDLTPTCGMGAIPECFRKQKGARRSDHPQVSFAAWGKHAAYLTADHRLEAALGEGSPLAKIYALDGWVLLLGVGHDSNTSLHLAEYRAHYPGKHSITSGAPVMVNGARQWVTFQETAWDETDFGQIGAAFAATGEVRRGRVGCAAVEFFRQRALVDFGVQWMEMYRG